MTSLLRLVFVPLLVVLAPALTGQCAPVWSPGGPQAELTGSGRCSTLWDPDGGGPLPQRLVIGGDSLTAGSQPASQQVMTWDGSQWQALGAGPGTGGRVYALTSWNGLLVAGGDFTGGGVSRIALWTGAAWQQIGTGFPVTVLALTVWNGNLVAAGYDAAGTTDTPHIRVWNGVTWSALPAPPQLHAPLALVSYGGFLCVGGRRTSPATGVLERWNGSSWSPSIAASARITCFAVRSISVVNALYIGGWFNTIDGVSAPQIASCGTSFVMNAAGSLGFACNALHARATSLTGYVVTAVTSNPSSPVMQYTGSSWAGIGGGSLNSLAYYGGSYHGAGYQTATASACQRYDGSAWVPVRGPGLDGEVRAAAPMGGDVIVGGTFLTSPDGPMQRIARWDGAVFHPVGAGLTGTSVDALLALPGGDVVAGGLFLQGGPVALNHVGRWNGSTWSAFGTGMTGQVLALCRLPNGDLVAAGRFTTAGGTPCSRIARWDGSSWLPLGSGTNGDVHALAARADGTLIAGGAFTTAGGIGCNRIAQWNGSAWSPLGAGCNADVFGLVVRGNGDVVATGAFTSAGGLPAFRCARWNGLAWAAMGTTADGTSQPVRAVLELPDGDLVVGHGFHSTNNPDEGIARWDGSAWTGFGAPLATTTSAELAVHTIAQRANGELVLGGAFGVADGQVSTNLARLASTCMPLVAPNGTGCSSAAGPLVLTADNLPWTGASFRTTTTGVPPGSLCLGLTGLSQLSIPLDLLLPEGQPGCTLLTALDILSLLLPGPGTAHSAFALADDPALLGVAFFQQTIPLEFDGTGAIVALRASNALALTIGTL